MKASEWLHERAEDIRDFAILAAAGFFFLFGRLAGVPAIVLVLVLIAFFARFF